MKREELKNIFGNIPAELLEEILENLIDNENFILERIISDGHVSPPNFWYDQDKNEFVMLFSGSAELIYDDGRTFILKPGDYMIIPVHQKHRVEKTSEKGKTIWLALHY